MLIRTARPGFSLVELMIATALSLLVCGAAYQLLVTTQRLARVQAEHLSLQSSVRAAVLIVVNELRELSSAAGGSSHENDLLQISPLGLTYRAMRGFGTMCQPSTATQIRLARAGFSGYRDPQAGRDSAFVYLGSATESPDDDGWLAVGISAVTGLGVCIGTQPGIILSVPATDSLNGVPTGSPVRIFEIAELKLYQSEQRSWLGLRSVSSGEVIQPLAGPLTETGLRFETLDREGRLSAGEIQSIRVSVTGISEGPVNAGPEGLARAREELVAQVALRNAVSW